MGDFLEDPLPWTGDDLDFGLDLEFSESLEYHLPNLCDEDLEILLDSFKDESKKTEVHVRTHKGSGSRTVTLDMLREVGHLPQQKAADALKIGNTRFKTATRELGMTGWPYRKIKSIKNLISVVEIHRDHFKDETDIILSKLKELEESIFEAPNTPLSPEFRRFRQAAYKLSHKGRKQKAKFSDRKDLVLYGHACLAAIGNGCIIPLFAVIFGDLVNAMGATNIQEEVNEKVLQLVYLSIGALCLGWVEVSLSARSTKQQVNHGKSKVFREILRKPLSWHQVHRSSDVMLTIMGKEIPMIQFALGETVEGIRQAVTAVAGLIVAFSRGAKLTLFVLTILPLLFLVNFFIKILSKRNQSGLHRHSKESNFAVKETFSNVKTVASFNLEAIFCNRYDHILSRLSKFSLFDSFLAGLEVSIIAGIFSFAYALTIYMGAKYVADGIYTGGQVIAVLFSAIMAGFSASQAIPCFNAAWNGHTAGQKISACIDRIQEKSSPSEPEKSIENLNMDIEFVDVDFAYPTNPNRNILSCFNLVLRENTSTAIVGPSGSGKSTIIHLLLKYYSPDSGDIFVDGVNLSRIPAKIWRLNIAYIPQEVCIFSGSIADNIRISKPSSSFNEVVTACKKARCHEFIRKLPNGYDTFLHSNNSLSGGQCQRIGIARAFLRDSKIILLDEATSALDNKSEQEINETMQEIFSGEKTVVSIAHKLSTVMSMDSIAVAKDGKIVEQGTHSDLMAAGNVYQSLVKTMRTADASFSEVGAEAQYIAREKPVLRESVLRKESVRLSIIPEKIRKKLIIGQKVSEDGEEETRWTYVRLILRTIFEEGIFSTKTKSLLALSLVSSCVMGLQYPAYSLALSGSVDAFLKPTPEMVTKGGSEWALVYTGIGVGFILFGALQTYSWAFVGEVLSSSIKRNIFQKALYRAIEWHEKSDNGASSMLTLLSIDSDNMKQALTTQIGALIETFVTLTASLIIAFYSSPTLALVILSVFPLLLLAQLVQAWTREGGPSKPGQGELDRFSFEATNNIRDILTFSVENVLSDRFSYLVQRYNNYNIWTPGLAFGLSQFMLYNTISLAFWYGTRQVASFNISVQDLMRAFCSLFFATFSLAQTNSQFGVMRKAKESAEKIQKVVQCDHKAVPGAKLPRCNGEISFDEVTFAYPSRPERLVFKHFNLHIKAHSSCALVGESGHGKSSCFGLLQAFYRPAEGVVRIDGVDINKLDISWIRHVTSFVTQDPVIFSGQSIRENISYGDPNANEQRVIEVAKAAYCHQFILAFPDGYDTVIGEGHVQLSGGQKQRIAIARAMLKNSTILLMDEPSAALDSVSEQHIQNSLQSFMRGKTCIVVAHRLGTIKDFDMIAAIYRGRVLEKGTHSELLHLEGYYNYLVQTQGP